MANRLTGEMESTVCTTIMPIRTSGPHTPKPSIQTRTRSFQSHVLRVWRTADSHETSFGFELLHVGSVCRDLPRDALDEPAVLLESDATFFELLDGAVVLVAQLRHGIGLPEQICDLVDLRHERRPELVKNHGISFDIATSGRHASAIGVRRGYFTAGSRSPAAGASARILPW